ncbi:MAG TPA: hypothetical protein ENL43_00815, partial [candidate division WOR-3 bacterium]|nr:hypothetical protein [candidate division WOR-3 bacterium]
MAQRLNDTLEDAMRRNPHLREYVEQFRKKYGKMPEFHPQLSRDMKDLPHPNIIYPVGDPIFIHIYGDAQTDKKYIVIEPKIETREEEEKYERIKDKILELAPFKDIPEDEEEFEVFLDNIFEEAVFSLLKSSKGPLKRGSPLVLTREEMEKFRYLLKRDIIGIGPLEALARDPYIEDIHIIGANHVSLVHKIFEALPTNISFGDNVRLANYLKNLSERIGRPVSDRHPIVDGTLPDGSRINIIYSPDISLKGPSATIRKFSATPLSITQLIAWKTLS